MTTLLGCLERAGILLHNRRHLFSQRLRALEDLAQACFPGNQPQPER